MFCNNCGKELVENAEFCPECGTKVPRNDAGMSGSYGGGSTSQTPDGGFPAGGFAGSGMPNAALNRSTGNTFKLVGIAAGVLAFLSMFMAWLKTAWGGNISASLFDSLKAEGGEVLVFLVIAFIVVFVVLQVLDHPRISLIGPIGMTLIVAYLTIYVNFGVNKYGKVVSFGFGYYLFIIATVLAYIAAVKGKGK